MSVPSHAVRKSPWLALAGLLIWGALVWRYDRFFLPLYDMVGSAGGRLIITLSVAWINVVWFYGVFHLLSVAFSSFEKPPRWPSAPPGDGACRVAILYTTRDDFSEEAAASCLRQDYAGADLFILDDSADAGCRERVDAFARRFPRQCHVVRREHRAGFKAGNLNYALRTAAAGYDCFAVVDADEILPPDFISRMIPTFSLDPRIGFVQANHTYRKSETSTFAAAMSGGVDLHWGLFLPARNRYGFVMFYGHGALIRTAVWSQAGGFPEVVSEDLAFAARVRELGFFGYFRKDVVAEEAFPVSYPAFLRREIKVARGTLEFMIHHVGAFLLSRRVTLAEKLDLLASVGVLFLPAPFIVYLIAANILVPLSMAWSDVAATGLVRIAEWSRAFETFGVRIRDIWSWDFYVLTTLTILAPLFYQLNMLGRSPARMLRYAARSTAIFLSIIPSVVWESAGYLLRRREEFLPTGDATRHHPPSRLGREIFSLTLGFVLGAFSVLTWNLALLTVASSFVLHTALLRTRWESRSLQIATLVPFVFFVSVFASIPLLLLGITGFLTVAVPAHH